MPTAMSRIASAATAATIRVGCTMDLPAFALEDEAEESGRQVDPLHLELLDELRTNASGLEAALDLALDDARLLEDEDVLHHDDIALHPLDLGDVRDATGAVLEPGLVDDEVDGRRDLLADRAEREVHAGHQDHRLETGEHVARAVRVAGGHRAVVAGIHRLEHVPVSYTHLR